MGKNSIEDFTSGYSTREEALKRGDEMMRAMISEFEEGEWYKGVPWYEGMVKTKQLKDGSWIVWIDGSFAREVEA